MSAAWWNLPVTPTAGSSLDDEFASLIDDYAPDPGHPSTTALRHDHHRRPQPSLPPAPVPRPGPAVVAVSDVRPLLEALSAAIAKLDEQWTKGTRITPSVTSLRSLRVKVERVLHGDPLVGSGVNFLNKR